MLSLFMFLRLSGAAARRREHPSASSRLVVDAIHELTGFKNRLILQKLQYLSDYLEGESKSDELKRTGPTFSSAIRSWLFVPSAICPA
jgi:hypothetical protein